MHAKGILLTAALIAFAPAAADPQGTSPAEWKAPAHLPTGAQYRLIREDPETHGIEAIVRFPSGYEVLAHTHTVHETIVVIKGRLRLTAAGQVRTLKPGDHASLPPGTPHALKAKTWLRDVWFLTTTDGPYDLAYTAK
ncbi:MAG: cupin domain-containing protein [Elusimicrobiota bacterium]